MERDFSKMIFDHGLTLFGGSIVCFVLAGIFDSLVLGILAVLFIAPFFIGVVGGLFFQILDFFSIFRR